MLRAGRGCCARSPIRTPRRSARLRHQAGALGVAWPGDQDYAGFIASLDPALPAHAALMQEATGVGRGARLHRVRRRAARRAHALRGSGAVRPCDRSAPPAAGPLRERVLPRRVGGHSAAGLGARGPARAAGRDGRADRRANAVERGCVDLVEAVLLEGREGELFDAVVIDEALVQLREPAVRGRLEHRRAAAGTPVKARLERADPATRSVLFSDGVGLCLCADLSVTQERGAAARNRCDRSVIPA